MRRFVRSLCCSSLLMLSCALPGARVFAADKWVHANSAHFDMYAAQSESDIRAALLHLEVVRAYFIGATHSQDPGGQPVRIVVFASASDFGKYRPSEYGDSPSFSIPGTPATIVALGLKPDMFEQIFMEYTQLVLDDSASNLPYWYRAGLSELYASLKPGDGTVKLGGPPMRSYKHGAISSNLEQVLTSLFLIDRNGIVASRGKNAVDFNTDTPSAKLAAALGNGAATTALAQVQSSVTEDYAGTDWILMHMLMFQPEYRPKFGEFTGAIGSGTEAGAAIAKVYGRSMRQVSDDLILYWKQSGLAVATAKAPGDKPAPATMKAATPAETDAVMASLAKKGK